MSKMAFGRPKNAKLRLKYVKLEAKNVKVEGKMSRWKEKCQGECQAGNSVTVGLEALFYASLTNFLPFLDTKKCFSLSLNFSEK